MPFLPKDADAASRLHEARNPQQKELSIRELSTLSGIPEAVLEGAESGTVEMTDEVSKEVQRVYWSLSALEATPTDYRRLLADIAMKAKLTGTDPGTDPHP